MFQQPMVSDCRGGNGGLDQAGNPGVLLVSIDPAYKDKWDWDLKYAKPMDVGFDLPVLVQDIRFIKGYDGRIELGEWFDIPPGSTVEVPTGLRVRIPNDSWGNVRARSSTGFKHGLIVLEGVIDPGYIGSMYVLVHNPTSNAVRIVQGTKLAQLVIIPRYNVIEIIKVDQLPKTERGETGFGSSGL